MPKSGIISQKQMNAIAVRDAGELFLFLSICRAPQGDVYVNFPRDIEPNWKPHSSYHASGQRHQKSFGHKLHIDHRQKPDRVFHGTDNIVSTGIASDEPRTIGVICEPTAFDRVMEIPLSELRPEKYCTLLSVDLVEPGAKPIITPHAKIVRQMVINDVVPWISITLMDTYELA